MQRVKNPKTLSKPAAGRSQAEQPYRFRLYISGITSRSIRAVENLKSLCEEYLEGSYSLEVIDIFQQPHRLRQDQIIAAPTLVRETPGPLKKILGDLSNREEVLKALSLTPLLRPTA